MRQRSVALRASVAVIGVLAVPLLHAANEPSLDEVVRRVAAYLESYGPQLAAIVAEEHYTQWVEIEPGTIVVPDPGREKRVIKSDFVLTRLGDDQSWVAFRDAFEVDGSPVRDREDRLVSLLSRGGEQDWRRASAIANESARFNIGSSLVTRNINVPTFVIQLLHEVHRERFRFSRTQPSGDRGRNSSTTADGQGDGRWIIEYRERSRPTLVRQPSGGDQPLRGTITVDPATGAVWGTHLTWERGPGGQISVTFGRVPDIDVLVPVRMREHYRGKSALINGEAIYTNFRRFQTSVRVLIGAQP